MKYLEILLLVLMLNTTVAIINETQLLPINIIESYNYNKTVSLPSLENFNSSVEVETEDTTSLAYKIKYLLSGGYFSQDSLDSGESISAGSDSDYAKGFYIFTEAFAGGVFYFEGTLNIFHIPKELHPFFVIPMYLMYALAVIQLISGRNLEAAK